MFSNVFAGEFSGDILTNATARTSWVRHQVDHVTNNFLDGVNVDFEGEIDSEQPAVKEGLTLLLRELSYTMRKELPHSQV